MNDSLELVGLCVLISSYLCFKVFLCMIFFFGWFYEKFYVKAFYLNSSNLNFKKKKIIILYENVSMFAYELLNCTSEVTICKKVSLFQNFVKNL